MASNGTSTPSAGPPAGPSTDEMLVYWLDIGLFGVLALFFLAAIPRTFGRLSGFSISKGLILRGGSSYASGDNANQYTSSKLDPKPYPTRYPTHEFGVQGRYPTATASPPTHVPALSTVMHPISSFFSRSFTTDKTFGKLSLCLIYIAGILVAVFYAGDPLADPERLGLIAVSQIPFVVVLGTKNNSIGMLVSMGYERLNYLHRLVGLAIFATANLHAVGYLYEYAFAGNLSAKLRVPFIYWGLIALIGIELIYVFSIHFMRQHFYHLFLSLHIVGFALFMVGAAMHFDSAVKYVLLGTILYGADNVLRIVKTRVTKARVRALPELGATQIELPTVTSGWRAGQHVRIRFLTTELGITSWTIAHPFTIANASDSAEGKGLVLLCKKAGRWTNSLYAAAEKADHYATEDGHAHYRRMSVLVEGPYGGLGNMVLSSYSAALIVSGGSGVTLALSAAEEIIQMVQKGKSNVRFIEVVWITQDINSLNPLSSAFMSIIAACNMIPDIVFKISVRYTRASANQEKTSYASDPPPSLPLNIDVQPGRPKIKHSLDSLIACASSLKQPTGVAVSVCGPVQLAAEVRETVRKIDGATRSSVGGVELHEEVFGW